MTLTFHVRSTNKKRLGTVYEVIHHDTGEWYCSCRIYSIEHSRAHYDYECKHITYIKLKLQEITA